MLATYYSTQVMRGLFFFVIAMPPAMLVYWQFFKKRVEIADRRRRRKAVAACATGFWLVTSAFPICYGDGRSWDVRLITGYLSYHEGEIMTVFSLRGGSYYEFANGLTFQHEEQILDSFLPIMKRVHFVVAALIPGVNSHQRLNGTAVGLSAHIPLWPFLGIPIAAFIVEEFRYRRFTKTGKCLGCGYDLRGSASTCPECGRKF